MEQQLQCQCFSLWTVVWQNDEEFQFHVENLCPPHIQDLTCERYWKTSKAIIIQNDMLWLKHKATIWLRVPPAGGHQSLQNSHWFSAFFFLFQLNSVKFCHESLWLCGSFLRSFPAFLFLFLLRKLSSLPLFFSSWYLSANSSFFFSATREKNTTFRMTF